MKTYQDLTALGDNERDRMEFVRSVVRDHLGSADYRIAADAEECQAAYHHRALSEDALYTDRTGIPRSVQQQFPFENAILSDVRYPTDPICAVQWRYF